MTQSHLDLGTFRPQVTLFDYQRAAADAVHAAWGRGVRRPAIAAATGSGKTVMFSAIAEESGERTLVIAHRKEIIDQAVTKAALLIDRRDIGVVMGPRDEFDRPVVVASIQSITSPDRLARLGEFGLVVVDEAHHAASPSYRAVLEGLGAGEAGPVKLLGVSATWDRLDGLGLDRVFDEIVYEIRVEELIAAGYLSDVRALVVESLLDLSGVGFKSGDYNADELGEAISQSHVPEAAAAAVKTYASDRKILMFAPTVETADEYAAALRAVGISAAMVHGGTPRQEREDLVTDLRAGRIQALTNCGVFTEGTDLPIVDCIAMGRPTRSRALYTQMAGRGLRKYPGKNDCLILDLVNLSEEHEFQTWADITGLDPNTVAASTRAGLARKRAAGEDLVTGPGATLTRPTVVKQSARSIDIVDRSRMAWATIDEATWSLPAGELGQVMIRGDNLGTFSVVRYGRARGDVETLGAGLDVGYAQGIAEDVVERANARGLVNPKATWRRAGVPATDRQLEALRKWRVQFDPANPPTRAEASDLLEVAIGRANAKRNSGGSHANTTTH